MPAWKRPHPIHTSTRTKLRSGPSIGLEREGLKALMEVQQHVAVLAAKGVWYDNAPESKWAPRRQAARPALPMQDMTYGGVSAAWAVVDGMA